MPRPIKPVHVVWKTDRGNWHQERTRRSAPDGVEVTFFRGQDAEFLRHALADADVLVSERTVPVDVWEIDSAPKLQLLLRLGSVPDRLPVDFAASRGIPVSLEPVPLCAVCAEHAILLALALLRGFPKTNQFLGSGAVFGFPQRTDEDTFSYNWTKRPSLGTLRGARIGILGMGGIGVEIALRLRAFGPASVTYTKRTPFSPTIEDMLGARVDSPENVLSSSDVVFCLLPYGSETDRWLNADRLASMLPGSFLVTVGSGSVVDEEAVLEAVRLGQLAGAAFDTFEWEPLPADHPLAVAGRDPDSGILLTPHVAAVGGPDDSPDGWDEIRRWMSGEALRHRIA